MRICNRPPSKRVKVSDQNNTVRSAPYWGRNNVEEGIIHESDENLISRRVRLLFKVLAVLSRNFQCKFRYGPKDVNNPCTAFKTATFKSFLQKFPVPRNVHEIRRFLGLTGYFRRFVPRYAEVAAPLNDLLKTNRAFIWDENVRKAFELLRDKIVTDCQALVYMNAHRTKNAQIVRWHGLLSEFNYEIVHREGAKLAHVDALSRAPVENQASTDKEGKLEEAIASVNIVNDVSVRNDDTGVELGVFTIIRESDEILTFQYKDEEIAARRDILTKPRNERSRMEKEMVKVLVITDGILYKNHNEKLCYFVPRSMRKSLVVRFHDYGGHQGDWSARVNVA
ncbi:hypothetical protein TKK_0010479 [Trichogramma kaykai]